ncbi:MAG: hypothetical protein ABI823_14260 [Bryobacteraceae bacterium]
MNCREFEELVREIAVGDPSVDPAVSRAAAEHSAGCAACGARLIAEHRLTGALRALSVSVRTRETNLSDAVAPPVLAMENRLLDAFRVHREQTSNRVSVAPKPVVRKPNVIALKPAGRPRVFWPVAIAAAAAIVAIFVSLRTETSVGEPARPVVARQTPPVREQVKNPLSPDPGSEPSTQAAASGRRIESLPVRRQPAPQRRQPQMVATEFVPLQRGDVMEPMDRGQLVRVQVPRMAMRNAGFPVREDRLSEPVLADVLVGEDGTARGIRFVKFTQ